VWHNWGTYNMQAILKELKILSEHEYDPSDPGARGPYVCLGNLDMVDGVVMDVYGETLEQARATAQEIIAMGALATIFAG